MSGKKFTFSPLRGLEKVADLVNIFNKAQEFITRRAVFQARLNNLILNNPNYYGGKNLKQIINDGQTNIIRKSEVAQAVDAALEITFAKNFNKYGGAYEGFAASFINFVNKVPFSFSLAIPFPRFMMNSLRFHFDFSPLGFLNFLSRSELSALAKGDTSTISTDNPRTAWNGNHDGMVEASITFQGSGALTKTDV